MKSCVLSWWPRLVCAHSITKLSGAKILWAAAHHCASVPQSGVSDYSFFLCVLEGHRMTIAGCFLQIGIPAGYQEKKKKSLLFLLWVLGVLWELISVMEPLEPLDGQIEVDCGFWVKAAKTVKAVWRCQIRWICFVVWTLVQTETPRQLSNCGELCGWEEGKWQHLTCKRISLKVYKYTSLLGFLIFSKLVAKSVVEDSTEVRLQCSPEDK